MESGAAQEAAEVTGGGAWARSRAHTWPRAWVAGDKRASGACAKKRRASGRDKTQRTKHANRAGDGAAATAY